MWAEIWQVSLGWPIPPATCLPGYHFPFQVEVDCVSRKQTDEPENSWSLAWEQGREVLSKLYSRMFQTWTYCLNCLSLGFVSTVISSAVCYTKVNLQGRLKGTLYFQMSHNKTFQHSVKPILFPFCCLCFLFFFLDPSLTSAAIKGFLSSTKCIRGERKWACRHYMDGEVG